MTWSGNQFSKPLIFLQREDLGALKNLRGYAPGDEVWALYPSEMISPELALRILATNDRTEDAVNLLCHSINPRVGVWWAYLCCRVVLQDVADDLAKDGLTPQQRMQKRIDETIAKLRDRTEIDAIKAEHEKIISDRQTQLQQQAKEQNYLNPVERARMKIEGIQKAFDKLIEDMPPGELGDKDAPGIMEDIVASLQQNAREDFQRIIDEMTQPDVSVQDPCSDRLYEAIREKTNAIKPAIDEELAKHFPLKIKGQPLPPSEATKSAALQAALRWLLVPTDENGQLACQAAIAAQSGPESMLAYAAFWSSTNLKTETGIAPTNPALPPLGISKTLLQLALLEGGEMDYDTRYQKFFELGIECADGTCTWDEHGNPVRSHTPNADAINGDDRVFHTRSGFGRQG